MTRAQGVFCWYIIPDSKVHGANMGPIWGRQGPGGPHVGSMNFAIWDFIFHFMKLYNGKGKLWQISSNRYIQFNDYCH